MVQTANELCWVDRSWTSTSSSLEGESGDRGEVSARMRENTDRPPTCQHALLNLKTTSTIGFLLGPCMQRANASPRGEASVVYAARGILYREKMNGIRNGEKIEFIPMAIRSYPINLVFFFEKA